MSHTCIITVYNYYQPLILTTDVHNKSHTHVVYNYYQYQHNMYM